jgi:hypothetical protein
MSKRKECLDAIRDDPRVTIRSNLTNEEYRTDLSRSEFVLCPEGTGADTHRFYESVYLKSIPIVLRTNSVFDRLYAAFPCLVVNEWSDITEELLDSSYPECWRRMREFHAKYPRFLTDLDSIEGLLMEL